MLVSLGLAIRLVFTCLQKTPGGGGSELESRLRQARVPAMHSEVAVPVARRRFVGRRHAESGQAAPGV